MFFSKILKSKKPPPTPEERAASDAKYRKFTENYTSWKEGRLYQRLVQKVAHGGSLNYQQKYYKTVADALNMAEILAAAGAIPAAYILWKIWQPTFTPKYYWKNFTKYSYINASARGAVNGAITVYTFIEPTAKLFAGIGMAIGLTIFLGAAYFRYAMYKPMQKMAEVTLRNEEDK